MTKTKIQPPQDVNYIAACGLYCGTCKKYAKGSCPGCKENSKATWCKIRQCNIDKQTDNCSECSSLNIDDCKKLNNFIGKAFKLIFKTDRLASLKYIKENGAITYSEKMYSLNQMSIKTNQSI